MNIPDAMGWLDGASSRLLQSIDDRADRVSYPAGHSYTRAGDAPGGLIAVVSGRVDLYLPNVREGRTLVYSFGPGWWVGDLAAISQNERLFDHMTALPTDVLRLSKREMERLCKAYPETWMHLARMTAANMQVAIKAAARNRLSNPTARIANCLIELNRTGPGWNGRLPISQADLASIADMSRRRTIGALEQLEGSDAIKREYRAVQILDSALLMDTASKNAG